ncbi:MAG: hypothetical protein PHC71_00175 [Candidatus Omnitrophica bacterium]|nr:hypothetical protein [Candidatus Omnitrophota bacterium]
MIEATNILEQYLESNSIFAEGYLAEDIKNKNWSALFYIIYAIKNFSNNVRLKEKIRLLAQKRGVEDNNNDVRRNYENQLVEFHALYVLTEKMKYNFIDFDISSVKQCAKIGSNCDILVEKDEKYYFVEAKQSSTELMLKSFNSEYNLIDINKPVWPDELGKYIKRLVKEGEDKGCDFLVLQVPKWGLPNLSIDALSNFLKQVSADITYMNGNWYWPIKDTHITKLIFLKELVYWEIGIPETQCLS